MSKRVFLLVKINQVCLTNHTMPSMWFELTVNRNQSLQNNHIPLAKNLVFDSRNNMWNTSFTTISSLHLTQTCFTLLFCWNKKGVLLAVHTPKNHNTLVDSLFSLKKEHLIITKVNQVTLMILHTTSILLLDFKIFKQIRNESAMLQKWMMWWNHWNNESK